MTNLIKSDWINDQKNDASRIFRTATPNKFVKKTFQVRFEGKHETSLLIAGIEGAGSKTLKTAMLHDFAKHTGWQMMSETRLKMSTGANPSDFSSKDGVNIGTKAAKVSSKKIISFIFL